MEGSCCQVILVSANLFSNLKAAKTYAIWYLTQDKHICNLSVMLTTAPRFYINTSEAKVASLALLKHFCRAVQIIQKEFYHDWRIQV